MIKLNFTELANRGLGPDQQSVVEDRKNWGGGRARQLILMWQTRLL